MVSASTRPVSRPVWYSVDDIPYGFFTYPLERLTMHHLAVFASDLAISAAYAQVAGIADGGLTRNSANLYIAPTNMRVLAAYVQGVTTNRAQLQSPSLRNLAYPEIAPIQITAVDPMVSQANFRKYYGNGPRLVMNEAFGIYASNSSGAAVSKTYAGLWLANQFTPSPQGQVTTLVGTSTNVLVVESWTLSSIAFETQIPAGRYSIIGCRIQCDDATFARLVFPGSTNFRPGVTVQADAGDKTWLDQFNDGSMGEFGQFDFNNPPQLEVFGHTAGSEAATVFLDVVKIG